MLQQNTPITTSRRIEKEGKKLIEIVSSIQNGVVIKTERRILDPGPGPGGGGSGASKDTGKNKKENTPLSDKESSKDDAPANRSSVLSPLSIILVPPSKDKKPKDEFKNNVLAKSSTLNPFSITPLATTPMPPKNSKNKKSKDELKNESDESKDKNNERPASKSSTPNPFTITPLPTTPTPK